MIAILFIQVTHRAAFTGGVVSPHPMSTAVATSVNITKQNAIKQMLSKHLWCNDHRIESFQPYHLCQVDK